LAAFFGIYEKEENYLIKS